MLWSHLQSILSQFFFVMKYPLQFKRLSRADISLIKNMDLVVSLWLLETIWTLDLFICQLRTHLHTNWCLIAVQGTKAQNYFNSHDLKIWPVDMLKASLLTPHFFFLPTLSERVAHCAHFLKKNQIAWWKVTEKWMSLWNNSMHHFLSFDQFDSLHWRPDNFPQSGLLCMITLRQSRWCYIREVRKSKYENRNYYV